MAEAGGLDWSGDATLGTRLAFQRANLNGGGDGGTIDFNELVTLLGSDPHAPAPASASAFPSASASAAAHGAAPRGQQRLASLLGAPTPGLPAIGASIACCSSQGGVDALSAAAAASGSKVEALLG